MLEMKLLTIMQALMYGKKMSTKELSTRTSMPERTILRHLHTLEDHGIPIDKVGKKYFIASDVCQLCGKGKH